MEDVIFGIKTHYYSAGKGKRCLVFLHGWGTDHTSFIPVMERIGDRYRIIAPDLPGFGKTAEPESVYGTDDYARFVKELLIKLGVSRPVVIGHSNGGRVAVCLSLIYDIDKMILVDSAGIKPKRSLKYYIKVYSYKTVKRMLVFLRCRGLLIKYSKNKGSEDYKKATDKMKAVMSRILNEDLRECFEKIDVPVLLFWGEKDTATPMADAKIINSLIKDSGIVTVKNGSHYSYLDDMNLFIRVLDKFLEG